MKNATNQLFAMPQTSCLQCHKLFVCNADSLHQLIAVANKLMQGIGIANSNRWLCDADLWCQCCMSSNKHGKHRL